MTKHERALASAFENLERSATRLNAASDKLNEVLKDAERRLVALNVGYECWLDGDDQVFAEAQYHEWCFGFTQPRADWCLAVLHKTYPHPEYDPEDADVKEEIIPLSEAPRAVRIAAIAALPLLLARLTAMADDAYARITGEQAQGAGGQGPRA